MAQGRGVGFLLGNYGRFSAKPTADNEHVRGLKQQAQELPQQLALPPLTQNIPAGDCTAKSGKNIVFCTYA